MGQFIINYPDIDGPRILDSWCGYHKYQEYLDPPDNTQPNPETKPQFAKRMIREIMKERIVRYEERAAGAAAEATAKQSAESDITFS